MRIYNILNMSNNAFNLNGLNCDWISVARLNNLYYRPLRLVSEPIEAMIGCTEELY